MGAEICRTVSPLSSLRTALTSPTDQLLYDNLRESAESSVGARVCNSHLWAISNQFGGWHVVASNTARVQPVGTDDARAREQLLLHD